MGSGILFRADKVHHSAEMVHTLKRAITLFINIKKTAPAELAGQEQLALIEDEKPVIRNVDMPEDMQDHALRLGIYSVGRFAAESDIADYVKTQFDEAYGGDWHCIVGRNYGSSITPLDGHFIYYSLQGVSVLLFR